MEELNRQSIIDEEHLKLLVLFHKIYGIIIIVFSLLSIGYFLLLDFLFSFSKNTSRFTFESNFQTPPIEIINIFKIILIIMIAIGLTAGVCNILSAQYIKRRRLRIFSIVVACVNCISFPLGTILGVLTLFVLLRNSVIEYYTPFNAL